MEKAPHAGSRAGAFAIVVLLHVVAVLMASRQRPASEREEERSLTLVDILPQAPVPPAELKLDMPVREQDLSVPVLPAPAAESAARAISAPPLDWRASMEAAATSAVGEIIRQQGYRSLGPVERRESGSSSSESPLESAVRSLFEQQPRHKAGDIESDAVQGRTVIWHNEHCYTELKFPTIKDPNTLPGTPNMMKCVSFTK